MHKYIWLAILTYVYSLLLFYWADTKLIMPREDSQESHKLKLATYIHIRDATIWVIAILCIAFECIAIYCHIAIYVAMIKFDKRTHHVFKTCF